MCICTYIHTYTQTAEERVSVGYRAGKPWHVLGRYPESTSENTDKQARCWEVNWDQSKWPLYRVASQPTTHKQGGAGTASTRHTVAPEEPLHFDKTPENIPPATSSHRLPFSYAPVTWVNLRHAQHGLNDLTITKFPKSDLWTKTVNLLITQMWTTTYEYKVTCLRKHGAEGRPPHTDSTLTWDKLSSIVGKGRKPPI